MPYLHLPIYLFQFNFHKYIGLFKFGGYDRQVIHAVHKAERKLDMRRNIIINN